jgi:hypothetical protein
LGNSDASKFDGAASRPPLKADDVGLVGGDRRGCAVEVEALPTQSWMFVSALTNHVTTGICGVLLRLLPRVPIRFARRGLRCITGGEVRLLQSVLTSVLADVRRSTSRVERSRAAADGLSKEITRWIDSRAQDERYARFAAHFRILRQVLGRMLQAIDDELDAIEPQGLPTGSVYQSCRAVERHLNLVRRTHEWYADKYDQRADLELAPALLAADELVRSCWTEPFVTLRRTAPSGPLVYLDARFDATATPRVSIPADLRAPVDTFVGELVRELPVPVIALPASCVYEPWWIVLAAHETGHHVQHDLAEGLTAATRAALHTATSPSPGDDTVAADWQRWAVEAFADAFSVLMVGTAATWAVEELQHAPAPQMLSAPTGSDRYPPAAVRTALLGEVARLAGFDPAGPGVDDVRGWLADIPPAEVSPAAAAVVERHLAVTRAAATALVDLPVADSTLRGLCAVAPRRDAPGGEVGHWAQRLVVADPIFTQRNGRSAARIAIAAGVEAYLSTDADHGAEVALLRENLPVLLAGCGPPGLLAAPAPLDVTALADRLAARLVADMDEER